MDIPVIISLVVGSLGFLLGVINILWGPNILGRRPKVRVTDPYLDFRLAPAPDVSPLMGSKRLTNLKIKAEFKLVRTKGDTDLFVKEAHIRLNDQLHKQFKRYFPPNFPYLRFEILEPKKLQLNEESPFSLEMELAGTDLGTHLLDLPQERSKFYDITTKMEENFEICWEYTHGTSGKYKIMHEVSESLQSGTRVKPDACK